MDTLDFMPKAGTPNPIARENGKLGGRPISSTNLMSQEIRRRLVERFNKDADELYDAQAQMAKGAFMAITDPDTGEIIKVVKRAPSVEAYKILLNQSIGMAKQTIDGAGENGEHLVKVGSLKDLTEFFRNKVTEKADGDKIDGDNS